jgi:hypothetical protein
MRFLDNNFRSHSRPILLVIEFPKLESPWDDGDSHHETETVQLGSHELQYSHRQLVRHIEATFGVSRNLMCLKSHGMIRRDGSRLESTPWNLNILIQIRLLKRWQQVEAVANDCVGDSVARSSFCFTVIFVVAIWSFWSRLWRLGLWSKSWLQRWSLTSASISRRSLDLSLDLWSKSWSESQSWPLISISIPFGGRSVTPPETIQQNYDCGTKWSTRLRLLDSLSANPFSIRFCCSEDVIYLLTEFESWSLVSDTWCGFRECLWGRDFIKRHNFTQFWEPTGEPDEALCFCVVVDALSHFDNEKHILIVKPDAFSILSLESRGRFGNPWHEPKF